MKIGLFIVVEFIEYAATILVSILRKFRMQNRKKFGVFKKFSY